MILKYKDKTLGGGSNDSAEQVYSTEETRIGTWIDGKPIYRKVFTGTTPNTEGSSSVIDILDMNIAAPVNLYGHIISAHNVATGSKAFYHFGWIQPGQDFNEAKPIALLRSTTLSIVMYLVGTSMLNKPFTIILEYTKTTD